MFIGAGTGVGWVFTSTVVRALAILGVGVSARGSGMVVRDGLSNVEGALGCGMGVVVYDRCLPSDVVHFHVSSSSVGRPACQEGGRGDRLGVLGLDCAAGRPQCV